MIDKNILLFLIAVAPHFQWALSEVLSLEPETNIVSGETANIEDFPYQLAFSFKDSDGNGYFCSAALCSDKHALSAAHCVSIVGNVDDIELRGGDANRKNGILLPVEKVAYHDKYDNPKYSHDVGILFLKNPVTFTIKLQAARLPCLDREVKPGSKVFISGWGKQESSDTKPTDQLQAATIKAEYDLVCFGAYLLTYDYKTMWCGGNFFFGNDGTCQGDSGGAAVQRTQATPYCIVGAISWGRGCGQIISPSVFSHVALQPNLEWILKTTGLPTSDCCNN